LGYGVGTLETQAAMSSRAAHRLMVGALLRSLRQEANLRQEDVASRLHKPQSYVSKYESGEQSLDVIEVADICEAVGTDLISFARELNRQLRAKP
jgi:transcriptional regulator with XRE-family HTH domain